MAPVLALLAALVIMYDGGPVLYRAKRVGRNAKLFDLYKFRSMVPHAQALGGGITIASDRRVTPVGRVMRRYKLDELPQLWNVLKGEMSFVGPRPEDPRYVALYTPFQRQILEHRPGITSPASLRFRSEESLLTGSDWERLYVEEILPKKLAMDLEYFARRTLWADMQLILRTVRGILR